MAQNTSEKTNKKPTDHGKIHYLRIHAITHYTLADFPFSRNSTPFSQNDTHSMPRFSRRKTVFTCRITAPRDNQYFWIFCPGSLCGFRDFFVLMCCPRGIAAAFDVNRLPYCNLHYKAPEIQRFPVLLFYKQT